MPDNIHNEIDANEIKDVGTIENSLYTSLTVLQKREWPMIVHVLYAVVTAMFGYLCLDGAALGFSGLLCVASLFLYPALCVHTMLYSPTYLKLCAALFPAAAYVLRLCIYQREGDGLADILSVTALYLTCVLIFCLLVKTVIDRNTKLWCFTAMSVCWAVFFVTVGIIYAVSTYGSIDLGILNEKLNEGISLYCDQFRSLIAVELQNGDTFEAFKMAIPELANKTPDEASVIFADILKQALDIFKLLIPGIFVLVCMFYGFISTAVFSVTAQIQKLPMFVCLMDNSWCYRIPQSCITFFDITLLVVIISNIFALPENISVTAINLMMILLPVMMIGTLKAIHFFIGIKLKSKTAATLLTIIIAMASVMILGVWGLLLLGTLGATLMSKRYRVERRAVKDKIKRDTEIILALHGLKDITELNVPLSEQQILQIIKIHRKAAGVKEDAENNETAPDNNANSEDTPETENSEDNKSEE